MPHTVDEYKKLFKAHESTLLDEYFAFLRFRSISADPVHLHDLQACAQWLELLLSESGLDVELWDKDKAPIVFASDMRAGPEQPTLLLYNHYDVQPVDPLALWHHDPFSPKKEGNLIYARGAQDNKGQCFYVLSALRLYLQLNKKFPINIKWIIEGEEESGSSGLYNILKEKKEALQCSSLLIVDLGMRKPHLPSITLGTRGLTSLDIEVQGTQGDLHSGMHGGVAYNPLHALVELLASLRDSRGRIQVPGFYDDVASLKAEELAHINLNFDEVEYEEQFGEEPTGGEKSFSPIERLWLRPTVEINGLSGGYQGPGGKTVIPSKAMAKISCRLVPHQDPQKIASLLSNYFKSMAPRGTSVTVTVHEGMGKPVRTSANSKVAKALETALKEVFWQQPEYILEGASIPIVSAFAESFDAEIGLFGLGLPSDNIHAPNECFGWDRIEKGFLTICRTIDTLATSNSR